MEIRPTGATLGAVVTDVNLGELDDASFAAIESAWLEHAVLIFPGQSLSDDEHLAFSRRFGVMEKGNRSSQGTGLGRLSNVKDGEVVAPDHLQRRFQRGNMEWHSDSSYKRVGAKASLLAAHVVPVSGGETEWADMRAAYDALDDVMKARLDGAVAVHSYRFSHTWHGGLEVLSSEELERLPPVEHLVVRVHPETGRKSLFVGRHASHIVGEEVDTSRALLRDLTSSACRAPRGHTHRWQPGDLVMWDNRCVLHRGRPWPDDAARVMVRTTVAGAERENEWAVAG